MNYTALLTVSGLLLAVHPLSAQLGGMGGLGQSGKVNAALAKLFGENTSFSANLSIQTSAGPQGSATIPGRMAFDKGKARFEMDLGQMKGPSMPAEAAAQMKTMGMDKLVMISRPDRKLNYLVYPGMKAYVETPLEDAQAGNPADDFKLDKEQLGKEKVGGYETVRNRITLTEKDGKKHEATVWNAVALKEFPVRILQKEKENSVTMDFKDIKLSAPEASQFDVPAGFTKHTDMQALMQQAMMKQFGGGAGAPGAVPK